MIVYKAILWVLISKLQGVVTTFGTLCYKKNAQVDVGVNQWQQTYLGLSIFRNVNKCFFCFSILNLKIANPFFPWRDNTLRYDTRYSSEDQQVNLDPWICYVLSNIYYCWVVRYVVEIALSMMMQWFGCCLYLYFPFLGHHCIMYEWKRRQNLQL